MLYVCVLFPLAISLYSFFVRLSLFYGLVNEINALETGPVLQQTHKGKHHFLDGDKNYIITM